MFSLVCLQWSKWKIVFPVWTKSILCVWRKTKCWDTLQKLWESYSGIRVCIGPFWALFVSFNTGDRSYNLLLSQAKGHRSNCWCLCLLGLETLGGYQRAWWTQDVVVWPFLSLDGPLQSFSPCKPTIRGMVQEWGQEASVGEETATQAWADTRRSVCDCGSVWLSHKMTFQSSGGDWL